MQNIKQAILLDRISILPNQDAPYKILKLTVQKMAKKHEIHPVLTMGNPAALRNHFEFKPLNRNVERTRNNLEILCKYCEK